MYVYMSSNYQSWYSLSVLMDWYLPSKNIKCASIPSSERGLYRASRESPGSVLDSKRNKTAVRMYVSYCVTLFTLLPSDAISHHL